MKFLGTDLGIKHIAFEVDGKQHFISFRFSHRKGISNVQFDSEEAVVIDAYPPMKGLLKECASIMSVKLQATCRKTLGRKKALNRSK